jgi:periplasmic protein TonB
MKKLFITLSFVLIGIFSANAQTNEPVYEKVDEIAEYKGGISEMYNFLGRNLKYPKPAAKANVTGKVYVKIVIEKNGTVSSPLIVKGIGFGCDQEVLRVVGRMPTWNPGKINGKAVRSSYVLPIAFALDNTNKSK